MRRYNGNRIPWSCLLLAFMSSSAFAENVLLIISDDLRANVLGCYGDTITHTPNLDRLAAEGIRFDAAYCQGTWCAPSRTSLMRSRHCDGQGTTLGETLITNGVQSVRVGKIFHMRVPGDIIAGTDGQDVPQCWNRAINSPGQEAHSPGPYACLNQDIFTDSLENRQTTKMPHRPFVTVRIDGIGDQQPDHRSASRANELLAEFADSEAPFFLAVGLVRPHYPMVAPDVLFRRYPFQTMPLPVTHNDSLEHIPAPGIAGSRSSKVGFDVLIDNQRRMWTGYRACVEFVDHQVGRMIQQLQNLGLDENTTVIFTSDHGYHLGDHTFWQKSNLHEQVARVPLIIRPSRRSEIQPTANHAPVELTDLYPTVCDLVGAPTPEHCQGTSLHPIMRDRNHPWRTGTLTIDGSKSKRHFLWRTNRYAYMAYATGDTELYDMQNDPHQQVNLAESPDHADIRSSLATQLTSRLSSLGIQQSTVAKERNRL
ncbi:MAG: sulfatase [Planctomycetota bacterium]